MHFYWNASVSNAGLTIAIKIFQFIITSVRVCFICGLLPLGHNFQIEALNKINKIKHELAGSPTAMSTLSSPILVSKCHSPVKRTRTS